MPRKKTLIAGILLISMLGSCTNTAGGIYDTPVSDISLSSEKENTPPITYEDFTAEEWLSTVKEARYNGYQFTIATSEQGRFVMYADDSESDVEKSINKRNALVEEKYGIKIIEKTVRESELINGLNSAASAGLQYADLISASMPTLAKLTAAGTLMNLYSLPYYDLNAQFCESELRQGATGGHATYVTFDELCMVQDNAWCTLFNKSLADADALYKSANDRQWTWDALLTAAKDSGFASYESRDTLLTVVFASSGVEPLQNGYGKALIQSENAELLDKTAKDVKNVLASASYRIQSGDEAKNSFKNGDIAFLLAPLSMIDELSASGTNFGLLPLPTFDGEYRSVLSNDAHGISVPINQSDSDRTGILLTALTAASYQHIAAAKKTARIYFDLRDNGSAIMLGKIYASLYANVGMIYSGGFPAIDATSQEAIIEAVERNKSFADIFKRQKTQLESVAEKYFR